MNEYIARSFCFGEALDFLVASATEFHALIQVLEPVRRAFVADFVEPFVDDMQRAPFDVAELVNVAKIDGSAEQALRICRQPEAKEVEEEALENGDELLKSRFYQFFGDIAINKGCEC